MKIKINFVSLAVESSVEIGIKYILLLLLLFFENILQTTAGCT